MRQEHIWGPLLLSPVQIPFLPSASQLGGTWSKVKEHASCSLILLHTSWPASLQKDLSLEQDECSWRSPNIPIISSRVTFTQMHPICFSDSSEKLRNFPNHQGLQGPPAGSLVHCPDLQWGFWLDFLVSMEGTGCLKILEVWASIIAQWYALAWQALGQGLTPGTEKKILRAHLRNIEQELGSYNHK